MEKIAPLISIIIPNYNHFNYLVQRLESVFNQTYTNFEVILLDDCSTDNSRAILLEYATNPKVSHCVFNEINSGNTFVQWNKGLSLAKGEYIWVAETDDFCELNFLEELIKPLIADKDIVLSYCQSNRVDENGVVTGTWLNHTEDLDVELFTTDFCMEGNEFVERFLIYKNVIPNASAVLIRQEVLKKNRSYFC
jgi:glycosyltransferase involved in cell wall biosynthesis